MAVAAVVARHKVGVHKMEAHAGRDRLLAGVLVDRAADMARLQGLARRFFEFADEAHGAQHLENVAARRRAVKADHGSGTPVIRPAKRTPISAAWSPAAR